MKKFDLPFWKDAPLIRIVLPFIAGILLSYYCGLNNDILFPAVSVSFSIVLLFSQLKLKWQYRYNYLRGVFLNVFIVSAGALIAIEKSPFSYSRNLEHLNLSAYTASLQEPPLEKKSSWKVLTSVQADPVTNVIVYFKKDSTRPPPAYGQRIVFSKKPERIKNFVTGSTFDYQRYCALKNIHYQVFLKANEYTVPDQNDGTALMSFIFQTQRWVIDVLSSNIAGARERGLAEALLIGYKNDLDKGLIQSYSNTGVVHVVAISGLHLGLIYSILNMLCGPFGNRKMGKLLKPVIVLTGLWIFSLLAGASPSVVRSAVMFSSVVLGKSFAKSSSLLNNLAASALLLLCYNPYWLWDLGFILSYAALLSIAMFMKPVYNLYISENKLIDGIWKLNAVTLSAQILTMPVLLYCFGRFPTLFLITNSIAIPLSGIILVGEIILCAVYFIGPVARIAGIVLEKLIAVMNSVVEYLDSFPFSSITAIDISLLQVILIYVIILFIAGKLKSWQ